MNESQPLRGPVQFEDLVEGAEHPSCPECGTEAKHRPFAVESGRACILVHHDHNCPQGVTRYIACKGETASNGGEAA